jgi:hypothetical protein
MVLPVGMLTYGFLSLNSEELQEANKEVQEEITSTIKNSILQLTITCSLHQRVGLYIECFRNKRAA